MDVVIEIGLDADGAVEHLRRQLTVVKIIDELDRQLSPDPHKLAEPGSELAVLAETAPDAPVNLLLSVRSGLTAARGALDQIASILAHNLPTNAIVLQALLRAALLGAGRVVFALAPADLEQRQRNVRAVLRQEGRSLMQGLDSFAKFEHLISLKPTGEYLEEKRRSNAAIADAHGPAGEAKALKEVARVIGEQLVLSGFNDSAVPDVLAEHIMWIWHAYSGAAHGFGWPWLLPGTAPMAGDFERSWGRHRRDAPRIRRCAAALPQQEVVPSSTELGTTSWSRWSPSCWCVLADAQHLPHGRHQAGDHHLKFYETRDNLPQQLRSVMPFKAAALSPTSGSCSACETIGWFRLGPILNE